MTNTTPPRTPNLEHESVTVRLTGLPLPNLALPSSGGGTVRVRDAAARSVLFVFPMIGLPDTPMPHGWDAIPGARGCTAETCRFRDLHAEFRSAGLMLFGLSSQAPDYQREAALRLGLPFPLLSDPNLELAESMWLPTFEVAGLRMYRRLTLVAVGGVVQRVLYPIDDPAAHPEVVLRQLQD